MQECTRSAASQGVLVVKNLPANAGDMRPGFNPWVRKIPWRRAWRPAPVFLPGESHRWRSQPVHGVAKSWTWVKRQHARCIPIARNTVGTPREAVAWMSVSVCLFPCLFLVRLVCVSCSGLFCPDFPHRVVSVRRCPPGWVGERCQLEDPCHSGPCAGRGVCQSSVVAGTARFTCRCPRGFRGKGGSGRELKALQEQLSR